MLQLQAIDETWLADLIANKTPETGSLEFKRELPGGSDKSRAEFLKDVCAFANANGGDLVFGIDEKNAQAVGITPISSEESDNAMRRLGQMLESGIEPRLLGYQFHKIPISSGGYALILRVSANFSGPYRYIFNGHSRFVVRSGTHISEFSYAQLKDAFDRTATIAEKARSWHLERLALIKAGRTWRPMRKGPLSVVHIIPLSGINTKTPIDLNLAYKEFTNFILPGWGGGSRSFNLDGVIIYPGRPDETGMLTYTQLFRNGAIEAVRYGARTIDDRPILPSPTLSKFIRDALNTIPKSLRQLDVSGPALIGISWIGVSGYSLAISSHELAKADRDDLILPEFWCDDIEQFVSPDEIARPALDMLWQSFEQTRCKDYDQLGNWNPQD